GSAGKLKNLANKCKIIGFDSPVGVAMAKNTIPKGEFIEQDLEKTLPALDKEVIEQSVIICSDVIEHLQQPDNLASQLAKLAKVAPFVIVSTPDRDRSRGRLDPGPPAT
ncbi:class I SAM-dependent methyltransferase, partial [Vibrio cholerae]|uniref:class I SAM-dependent methyltransferase n=1 Tax=Vibrio cholerae TaxID=666 RepID=UPI0018F07E66